MKNQLYYYLIAVFSIFVGSQMTEGVLLVPYWQSMSSTEFYSYYQEFGPAINRFYTILTIVALLIPVALSVYFYKIQSQGFRFALISSVFAMLFVFCFYVYFKETNQAFFQSAFSAAELKNELVTWANWHWGRVVLECLSLVFLILAISKKDSIPR
ncbi:MAG: hypothetical protein ABJH98_04850 [Reichenbachiella sp.]|uniref:hypothetical protein n=1 Tax=Reichenbachiella sp. TaxID=2184521 RepID=UPI0032996FDD